MLGRPAVGAGVKRRVGALVTTLAMMGSVASAQDKLLAFDGDAPLDQFGQTLAMVGDLNGDGVSDFMAASPRAWSQALVNAGEIRVYSGANQEVLFVIQGQSATEELGFALAGMEDVDQDGFPDILAGAPFFDAFGVDTGCARVYSGATAQPILQVFGQVTYQTLGLSVACAGDLNTDGVPELLVGVPATNSVRLVSGADGATTLIGSIYPDFFGTSVAGGSDVNGDGIPDFLVTAPLTPVDGHIGAVHVYSGADVSVLMKLTNPTPLGSTGNSCAFLGDLDMDGRAEIALGSWTSASAAVFSGGTGQVLYTYTGSAVAGITDDVGFSIASCGDQNADGIEDFALGAPNWTDASGQPLGLVRVVSGIDGTILSEVPGDGSDDLFGYAIVGVPDVNGDALPDLLMGAPFEDEAGTNSGRAVIASLVQKETLFVPFQLGDRVTGITDVLQKTHGFSFAGLGSTVMKLVAQPADNIALDEERVVSIRNKAGGPEVVLQSDAGSLKYTLPNDGEYELRIRGADYAYGEYAFKSSRQLPEFAKSKKWKLIAKPAHYIPFLALPGATVKIVIKSAWKKSQYDVVLLDPGGVPVDLSSGVLNNKGVYKAKEIGLDKVGLYQLRVSGFLFSKEKLTVKIGLNQPKGKDTVVWSE